MWVVPLPSTPSKETDPLPGASPLHPRESFHCPAGLPRVVIVAFCHFV
jgi:hypothetical protein